MPTALSQRLDEQKGPSWSKRPFTNDGRLVVTLFLEAVSASAAIVELLPPTKQGGTEKPYE